MTEVTDRHLLARPIRNSNSLPHEKNIFAALRSKERLPSVKTIKGKQYHVIGSKQLRSKVLEPQEKEQIKNKEQNQTGGFSQTFMNTTINRQTIVSKINKEHLNILNREGKQMNRYKEYKALWDEQSEKLKRKTMRKQGQKTLLQKNVKDLYIHENQDRMSVINDFVVNYWEMSLRNNNKILKRHIKGNKYGEVELQEMLQTDRGVKTVEKSIPVLPLEKIKQVEGKELSLAGRSKAMSETHGFSERLTGGSQSKNQEQVFRVSYTGDMKWMSTEGL